MKNIVDIHVGRRLRDARKKRGKTLTVLARQIGISFQQLQKYEQGETRLCPEMLYKISQNLSVPLDYLFEGVKEHQTNLQLPPSLKKSLIENKKFKIILLENESDEEFWVRKALENKDVDIYNIHDGEEALNFFKDRKSLRKFPLPDMILLTLNLPKIDGKYLLQQIKKDPETCYIPIIVLIDNLGPDDLINIYKSHANGCLFRDLEFSCFQENLQKTIEYWQNIMVLPYAHHKKTS